MPLARNQKRHMLVHQTHILQSVFGIGIHNIWYGVQDSKIGRHLLVLTMFYLFRQQVSVLPIMVKAPVMILDTGLPDLVVRFVVKIHFFKIYLPR